jgi:hypothetical protein
MTSTPDYRALCAELLDEAIYLGSLPYEQDPSDDLLTRARALLAAPEAVGVTDEELVSAYAIAYSSAPVSSCERRHVYGLQAVLACYAHPAPVPVGERLPGDQ